MVVGGIMTNVAMFQGESSVMFTSYVPMQARRTSTSASSCRRRRADRLLRVLRHAGRRQEGQDLQGSVPLVTFGAITAAIIATFTILSGAGILIPTFLWSIGLIKEIDPQLYRMVWWALGHSSQQINVAAHVSIWYLTPPSCSVPSRCPRRSAAAPSCSTSCSCNWPVRTTCWPTRA
jgi:cytochrome c oxidase subunit 1